MGVNFHNLILLSPQCLRNRGERAWWRRYGAVNKHDMSAQPRDVKVTEVRVSLTIACILIDLQILY